MLLFAAAAVAASIFVPSPATETVDVRYLRITSEAADPELDPVFLLHGWSADAGPEFLAEFTANPAITELVAELTDNGRTVYIPFLGSNWGGYTSVPATGGAGLQAIDDVRTAEDITGEVDVVAISAGATTAFNYLWRNPDVVDRVFLIAPVFSLDDLHARDTPPLWTEALGIPSVTDSLDELYPVFDVDSRVFDPWWNPMLVLGVASDIAVYAARDDEIIPFATLLPWTQILGIQLTASSPAGVAGGGHGGLMLTSVWSPSMVEGWFGT